MWRSAEDGGVRCWKLALGIAKEEVLKVSEKVVGIDEIKCVEIDEI